MKNRSIVGFVSALCIVLAVSVVPANGATPAISSQLLRLGQMPIGWTAADIAGVVQIKCLNEVLAPVSAGSKVAALVTYESGDLLPALTEKIGASSTSASTYQRDVATVLGCKHVVGDVDGTRVVATIRPMSFPHFGSSSAAFLSTISLQGVNASIDVVIIRKLNFVLMLAETDVSRVNVNQLRGFAVKAVADVK